MEYTINLITEWQSQYDVNEMRVAVEYPGSWSDMSEQVDITPAPNMVIVRGAVSATTLTALQADANVLILTFEEVINETIG